ncbi:MAG: hypothetical protein KAU20_07540 [Nanoarchaeota archaeon]|nr:hypothetical protein [Nanoarchaeota archaeon]
MSKPKITEEVVDAKTNPVVDNVIAEVTETAQVTEQVEVAVEDAVSDPVSMVSVPVDEIPESEDATDVADFPQTGSGDIMSSVPSVAEIVDKVIKNEGVTLEIESVCKWCGAGKFTQTLVFCSEDCKNSYIASKGL